MNTRFCCTLISGFTPVIWNNIDDQLYVGRGNTNIDMDLFFLRISERHREDEEVLSSTAICKLCVIMVSVLKITISPDIQVSSLVCFQLMQGKCNIEILYYCFTSTQMKVDLNWSNRYCWWITYFFLVCKCMKATAKAILRWGFGKGVGHEWLTLVRGAQCTMYCNRQLKSRFATLLLL